MRRLKLCCWLFLFAAAMVGRAAAADQTMTLESLAAALQAQLSSIQSIDVAYELESDLSQAMKDAGLTNPPGQLLEWAEQGECVLFEEYDRENPQRLKSAVTFDGRRGHQFVVRTKMDGSPLPPQIVITKAVGDSYQKAATLGFTYGKRGSLADKSLPELMRLPGSALVGEETISGRRCYKVDIARTEGPAGKTVKIDVWLDCEHDYLPARIVWRYDTGDPQFDRFVTTMEIKDYLRVRDAASGAERWFAKLATAGNEYSHTSTLKVKSVTINQPLKLERFRPKAPDGTTVIDMSGAGEPKSYTLGGQKAQQAMIERAAEQTKREMRSAPSSQEVALNARPQHGLPVATYVLVAVGAVCMSIVAYRMCRR
ncbi:MAG TPA: hypothetical protein VMV10_31815 [Pirellulales bacterium]|nr:hypothetical protein [Pirellulales bacterium]